MKMHIIEQNHTDNF